MQATLSPYRQTMHGTAQVLHPDYLYYPATADLFIFSTEEDMKTLSLTLPPYKGKPQQVGFDGRFLYHDHGGNRTYLLMDYRFLWGILSLLGLACVLLTVLALQPAMVYETRNAIIHETPVRAQLPARSSDEPYGPATQTSYTAGQELDVLEHLQYLENAAQQARIAPVSTTSLRDQFTVQKQIIVSKFLIAHKVSRLDQLSDAQLVELCQQLGATFRELIFEGLEVEPHVREYFLNDADLRKIETSLMEQIKYHVPASITLAQSALETSYGRRVMHNNYFGIKEKNGGQAVIFETTEYYTAQEAQFNKDKIISKQKVRKDGRTLYKCRIRDRFTAYETPWKSFRAHSEFLSTNERYSPLFTKGKDYRAWADKIGSTKYGGVGYATSPIYGELLKKIIQRYHLDLLDF